MAAVATYLLLPAVSCFTYPIDQENHFDGHLLVSTALALKERLGSVHVTVSSSDHQPSTLKYIQDALGPVQISSPGYLSSKLTICLIWNSDDTFEIQDTAFWNTEFYYILHFVESEPDIEKIFNDLWDFRRVYRVFVVFQKNDIVETFDPVLRKIYRIPTVVLGNTNLLDRKFPDWNMTDFYAVFAGLYIERYRNSRSFLVDRLTLDAITERLNLRLRIKNTTDTFKFGFRIENGSFYGTFKELVAGRANMTAQAHFLKMYNIMDSLSYSAYSRADKICIAVPRRGEIPRFIKCFRSFNITVWLSIIIIYVITAMTLRYLRCVFYRVNRRLIYKTSMPFTIFGICLGQPVDYMPKLQFEKLILCSILLVSFVVVSVMQSTLNAILSTPPSFYKVPNTRDEFNEQRVEVWTSSKDLIDSYIAAGYTGVKFHLKTVAEQRTDLKAINYNVGILEKTAAVLQPKDLEFRFVKLQMTEACPVQHNIAYLYPRGSPFEEPINRILTALVESGVMLKWDRSVYQLPYRTMRFAEKIWEVVELKSISVDDLDVPFYLTCSGFVVASVVFFSEILVHTARKRMMIDS